MYKVQGTFDTRLARLLRLLTLVMVTALGVGVVVAPPVQAGTIVAATAVPSTNTASCAANDNLKEVADKFISRCRKGSIRREFPKSQIQRTVGAIKVGKSAEEKKAWKLLNENRFKK